MKMKNLIKQGHTSSGYKDIQHKRKTIINDFYWDKLRSLRAVLSNCKTMAFSSSLQSRI